NATEKEVIIKAGTNERKYYKFIKTPVPVDPDSAAAKYNNGVLEVTFKFKDNLKPDVKSIKIE
ncbi:MAG: Hsp20 family protein, partial [Candidatus Methanoperedens sp.]